MYFISSSMVYTPTYVFIIHLVNKHDQIQMVHILWDFLFLYKKWRMICLQLTQLSTSEQDDSISDLHFISKTQLRNKKQNVFTFPVTWNHSNMLVGFVQMYSMIFSCLLTVFSIFRFYNFAKALPVSFRLFRFPWYLSHLFTE